MRKLRPYQGKGKADIFLGWQLYDILMFVLATGGGKTFTFTEIIREFLARGERAMLIAHRTELIEQSWKTLWDAKVVAGIIKSGQKHITIVNSSGSEVKISVNNPERLCQVCSIQTIARRKHLPHADLIVIDEGHHVQDDNTYGVILDRYPNAKVLIVTATPYRLSGDGFRFLVKDKETGLIINCTLKELIDEGWLVPLQYHIGSIPDLSSVDLKKGDFEESGLQKVMEMAPLVDSYLMHVRGMQGLCFCVNVAHSEFVCKQYNDAGISAVHIDANTPDDVRREYLKKYRAGLIKIVCNVGIFTEGTDFPGCQFVQLAAPSKSLSKIFQEIGRVTRPLPGIVDLYDTAEERRYYIAVSQKPYGIVLDNAGTWLEHGFADDEVDWRRYFNGWIKPKEKKGEEPEYIEIPIFEVMKPDGTGRKTTSIPEEVEGMILIKITKEMRVNLRAMKHIKEFDRLHEFALGCAKITKAGYFAYYRYREHCDSNGIEIPDIAWKYIRERLCDDVEKEVEGYLSKFTQPGQKHLVNIGPDVAKIRLKGVHKWYLQNQWRAYKAGDRSFIKAKEHGQSEIAGNGGSDDAPPAEQVF